MAGPNGTAGVGQLAKVSKAFAEHLVSIGAATYDIGKRRKGAVVAEVADPPNLDSVDEVQEAAVETTAVEDAPETTSKPKKATRHKRKTSDK